MSATDPDIAKSVAKANQVVLNLEARPVLSKDEERTITKALEDAEVEPTEGLTLYVKTFGDHHSLRQWIQNQMEEAVSWYEERGELDEMLKPHFDMCRTVLEHVNEQKDILISDFWNQVDALEGQLDEQERLVKTLYTSYEWKGIQESITKEIAEKWDQPEHEKERRTWGRLRNWKIAFDKQHDRETFWKLDVPDVESDVKKTEALFLSEFKQRVLLRDEIHEYVKERDKHYHDLGFGNGEDDLADPENSPRDEDRQEDAVEREWAAMYHRLLVALNKSCEEIWELEYAKIEGIDDINAKASEILQSFNATDWNYRRDMLSLQIQRHQAKNDEYRKVWEELQDLIELYMAIDVWSERITIRREFWTIHLPDVSGDLSVVERLYEKTYTENTWFRSELVTKVEKALMAPGAREQTEMYKRLLMFFEDTSTKDSQQALAALADCGDDFKALESQFKASYQASLHDKIITTALKDLAQERAFDDVDTREEKVLWENINNWIADFTKRENDLQPRARLFAEIEDCYDYLDAEKQVIQNAFLDAPDADGFPNMRIDVGACLKKLARDADDEQKVRLYTELTDWVAIRTKIMKDVEKAAIPQSADKKSIESSAEQLLEYYSEHEELRPRIHAMIKDWAKTIETLQPAVTEDVKHAISKIDAKEEFGSHYIKANFFEAFSRYNNADKTSLQIQLQHVAARWHCVCAIETIPRDILPTRDDLPRKWKGVFQPSDLRNWGKNMIDALSKLSTISVGRGRKAMQEVQSCVRKRVEDGRPSTPYHTHMIPADVEAAILRLQRNPKKRTPKPRRGPFDDSDDDSSDDPNGGNSDAKDPGVGGGIKNTAQGAQQNNDDLDSDPSPSDRPAHPQQIIRANTLGSTPKKHTSPRSKASPTPKSDSEDSSSSAKRKRAIASPKDATPRKKSKSPQSGQKGAMEDAVGLPDYEDLPPNEPPPTALRKHLKPVPSKRQPHRFELDSNGIPVQRRATRQSQSQAQAQALPHDHSGGILAELETSAAGMKKQNVRIRKTGVRGKERRSSSRLRSEGKS